MMIIILINAYKSTEKGVISISIVKKASNYTIKIKDNGVGMNASMLRYLITGKSKDEVENFAKYKKGNGVGYQIIRNIVKLMKAKCLSIFLVLLYEFAIGQVPGTPIFNNGMSPNGDTTTDSSAWI